MSLFDTINSGGTQLLGVAWPTVWALVRILVVAVVILLCVAYLILWERKLIGWMHVRRGPMYVGMGIFQAFADVFKLLFKEVVQPSQASKFLYILAPLIVLAPSFAAWAVVGLAPHGIRTPPLVIAAALGLLFVAACVLCAPAPPSPDPAPSLAPPSPDLSPASPSPDPTPSPAPAASRRGW